MRLLVALCLLVLVGPVKADRWTVISYECEQMTAEKNGIRCAMHYLEGSGHVLFIRVYGMTPSDPKERRKRTSYEISRLIHNFLSVGGRVIQMRAPIKGVMKERFCARVYRKDYEHCDDWKKPQIFFTEYWAPLESK